MDTLQRHRQALFNAFSDQFIHFKKDLEKDLQTKKEKHIQEKNELQDRIDELEKKLFERTSPISTPRSPPKEIEITHKQPETRDIGTETELETKDIGIETELETTTNFSISEFQDKINQLNDTIYSLQTELKRTKDENEDLIKQARKPLYHNGEAQTDEETSPIPTTSPPKTNSKELESWKSKAQEYRERYNTLKTAHIALSSKYAQNKSTWVQWTNRDANRLQKLKEMRDQIRELKALKGIPLNEEDELPENESGPPQISPSKPPPLARIRSSPPPVMAALQASPAVPSTPTRIKAERDTGKRTFTATSEIADSEAEDSDSTHNATPEPEPALPVPNTTRKVPKLRKAHSVNAIYIKSEPGSQSGLGRNSAQDYSEIDLDDVGAKAPTPRIQRTVSALSELVEDEPEDEPEEHIEGEDEPEDAPPTVDPPILYRRLDFEQARPKAPTTPYIKREPIPHPFSAPPRRPMDPIDPNSVTPSTRLRPHPSTEPRRPPPSHPSPKPKPTNKRPTRISNHTLQEFGEGGEDEHSLPPPTKQKQLTLDSLLETPAPARPDLRKRPLAPNESSGRKKRKSDALEQERALSPSRFVVNAEKNDGLDYAYKQTVRGHARKCLPGCVKSCCKDLPAFTAAAGIPAKRPALRFRSSSPDKGPSSNSEDETARQKRFLDMYGRHREAGMPRGTPPGFWRTEMPGTQELQEDREKAEEDRRRRAEVMREEAERGGYWRVRERE